MLVYRWWDIKGLEGVEETVRVLCVKRQDSNRSPIGQDDRITRSTGEQPSVNAGNTAVQIAYEDTIARDRYLLDRSFLFGNNDSLFLAIRREFDQLRTVRFGLDQNQDAIVAKDRAARTSVAEDFD